ncbi:MAG TPA: family 43 glycosylhydrolase [Verrucomicrobiota bacterium]|nr:family 43 glycosylhydrolase [Verrucomicrobiota bacterium]HNU52322.1 family 43 glycosylhydrolase [Verrucomicrobiota bacterium]
MRTFDLPRTGITRRWRACLTALVGIAFASVVLLAYENPIIQGNLADPAVIRHQGVYYLYATGGVDGDQGTRVYTSTNLVDWVRGPVVFRPGPPHVWAPDVWRDPASGRFYLYYTVNQTVGVADADGPLGPFTLRRKFFDQAIDAHLFRDDDGQLYLYYVQLPGFRISVQRMATPTEPAGSPKVILEPQSDWEKRSGHVTEGPWLIKRAGRYYLLYSGSGADTPNYAVGYATAESPLGPFTRAAHNPIVQRAEGLYGPGHGCAVQDDAGRWWHVYHQKANDRVEWNRFICLDPLEFDAEGRLHGRATRGTPQPPPTVTMVPDRLNVLFVFADDWGRYASCFRGLDARSTLNDVVRTPHVDRVAREGVLFRNAFVNAPSCTPCRSSLLSGRFFFNTGQGAILQGARWDPAIPTFPLLLRDAGYHIGKSYKVWSPGTPVDAPFGQQQYAFERAGRAPNNFSEETTARLERGIPLEEARAQILAQVRQNFEDFLAARPPDRPWFYFFGPTTTHRTWIKGSGKRLWDIDPESLRGRMPAFLPDVPEVREDVADYLGECQAVDAYVGVLLERLEALGELERTLIVLSGDHGMPGVPAGKCNLYDHGVAVVLVARMPHGTPGRVVDDLVCLPDLAPTFLEIGGVKPPPNLYGRSLVPHLRSDRAGQIDPNRTWVVTGRERHVAGARDGNLPYPMRALRTSDFLYIRNFAPDRWPLGAPGGVTDTETPAHAVLEQNTRAAYADMDASPTKAWLITHRHEAAWQGHYHAAFGKRPAEELYDLRRDPDQVRNLADDPAHAARKQGLAARLQQILSEAGDPRVTGAGDTFDRPPFTDPQPSANARTNRNRRAAGAGAVTAGDDRGR